MTSLPPQAAELPGGTVATEGAPANGLPPTAEPATLAAATSEYGARYEPVERPRSLPPIVPSQSPVELLLDLRDTPPEKFLARLFGALERVAEDVTLLVQVRDTPEYIGVLSSTYSALRQHGYVCDSSRFPPGTQRLRVSHRPQRRYRPNS